jgi:DMSO reductase anchor subunit
MHPAFSVIFFSTLTGLGYGVWAWAAFALLARPVELPSIAMHVVLLAAAAVPVVVGLVSSTFHLGRPLRAWRAFSQWRTSWLSREGVLAVVGLGVWAAVVGSLLAGVGDRAPWMHIGVAAIGVVALATVACTAMIYASLVPVPAWRHPLVVPAYLGFALLTGGLVVAAAQAVVVDDASLPVVALLLLAVAMVVVKRRYWRDIDRGTLPTTRASALGLPAGRHATVFERPHTEASYLTKEMGFVVARRHAGRLRSIALVLFGAVPVLACVLSLLWPPVAAPALVVGAVAALLGTLVERWLFFAEAKHLVTLYY